MDASASGLRDTIIPKSDQLNADDFMAGPGTYRITGVARTGDPEQPLAVRLEGQERHYKPNKSMRRLLIEAWGDNGKRWIDQSLTLFRDETVKFNGQPGGIRISNISGIKESLSIWLPVSRTKKILYTVHPMPPLEDRPSQAAPTVERASAPLPPLISPAQHKRLEALIKESGVPRERIKTWLARSHPDAYPDGAHLDQIWAAHAAQIETNLPKFAQAIKTEAEVAKDPTPPADQELPAALAVAKRAGWSGDLAELSAVILKLREQASDIDDRAQSSEQTDDLVRVQKYAVMLLKTAQTLEQFLNSEVDRLASGKLEQAEN